MKSHSPDHHKVQVVPVPIFGNDTGDDKYTLAMSGDRILIGISSKPKTTFALECKDHMTADNVVMLLQTASLTVEKVKKLVELWSEPIQSRIQAKDGSEMTESELYDKIVSNMDDPGFVGREPHGN